MDISEDYLRHKDFDAYLNEQMEMYSDGTWSYMPEGNTIYIDVQGNVIISNEHFVHGFLENLEQIVVEYTGIKLDVRFRKITGMLYIEDCYIETLILPQSVGSMTVIDTTIDKVEGKRIKCLKGDVKVSNCIAQTLEFLPHKIEGALSLHLSEIKSLKGFPKKITGDLTIKKVYRANPRSRKKGANHFYDKKDVAYFNPKYVEGKVNIEDSGFTQCDLQ